MVEVDLTPDLTRFCFHPIQGVPVAKPNGTVLMRLVYESLLSTVQNGHLLRQGFPAFIFPPQGSSFNRIASVDLSTSELNTVIWPKCEKVFQDFLRNKNSDWNEMTVPLNFFPSCSLFLSSDCFVVSFLKKAFNLREPYSCFGNKLPIVPIHILDKEVKKEPSFMTHSTL